MTESERLRGIWQGNFGTEYTKRNHGSEMARKRHAFWYKLAGNWQSSRVLEVGCGDGRNLGSFTTMGHMAYGVDVNALAISFANQFANVIYAWATDLPFKDNFFDLVFCAGLLIHVCDDDVFRVMSEMRRCSADKVLIMEYAAQERTVVKYRRQKDALIKRPYGEIYRKFFDDKLIDQGFAGKAMGFDDVTWWLWRKTC